MTEKLSKTLQIELDRKDAQVKNLETQIADLKRQLDEAQGEFYTLRREHAAAVLAEKQAVWKPTANQQHILDHMATEHEIVKNDGWLRSPDSYIFVEPYERLDSRTVHAMEEIGAIYMKHLGYRDNRFYLTDFGKSKAAPHD